MILLTVFSGFCVGLLVGLTGVGGGSLMTPILILLFGRHATIAVGTDLIYATVTKSVGGLVHGFRGSVDWPIVARLAAGSLPATVVLRARHDDPRAALPGPPGAVPCRH